MNATRRAGLVAWVAWLETACAVLDDVAPRADLRKASLGATPMLTPWLTLSGGWRGAPIAATSLEPAPVRPILGQPARVNFLQPLELAARDDILWVADAGLRHVFRVDRARDLATPMATLSGNRALAMHASPNGAVWIADAATGQIRMMDRDGRPVHVWQNVELASRPVGLAMLPGEGGEVFVADAQMAHVVVFDVFGRALRRFGKGRLQSVAAMAAGPGGLFVLDRLAQQVLVFDRSGQLQGMLGSTSLVMPGAIAVDRTARVFVSDEADGAIHAFVAGEHVARYSSAELRVSRIDAIAVDGNLLFVADALTGRVQILLIAPESLRSPSPP